MTAMAGEGTRELTRDGYWEGHSTAINPGTPGDYTSCQHTLRFLKQLPQLSFSVQKKKKGISPILLMMKLKWSQGSKEGVQSSAPPPRVKREQQTRPGAPGGGGEKA